MEIPFSQELEEFGVRGVLIVPQWSIINAEAVFPEDERVLQLLRFLGLLSCLGWSPPNGDRRGGWLDWCLIAVAQPLASSLKVGFLLLGLGSGFLGLLLSAIPAMKRKEENKYVSISKRRGRGGGSCLSLFSNLEDILNGVAGVALGGLRTLNGHTTGLSTSKELLTLILIAMVMRFLTLEVSQGGNAGFGLVSTTREGEKKQSRKREKKGRRGGSVGGANLFLDPADCEPPKV